MSKRLGTLIFCGAALLATAAQATPKAVAPLPPPPAPAAPAATPAPAPAPAVVAPEPLPPPPPPAPVAPVVAPSAPAPASAGTADMSGQFGAGVGISAGATTLISPVQSVMLKYFLSDKAAIMPALRFNLTKVKDREAAWELSPSFLYLVTPWKTTSTRLNMGGGLGITLAQRQNGTSTSTATSTSTGTTTNPPAAVTVGTDITFAVRLPVYLGVEHFFTNWFSMGIAATHDLFSFANIGDAWALSMGLDTTRFMGSMFFYTD